jgi:hypothetical protein
MSCRRRLFSLCLKGPSLSSLGNDTLAMYRPSAIHKCRKDNSERDGRGGDGWLLSYRCLKCQHRTVSSLQSAEPVSQRGHERVEEYDTLL